MPEDHYAPENSETQPEEIETPAIENVETLEVPQNVETVEEPAKKTYEDAFMEKVQGIGPIRQRKIPTRFQDEDCLVVNSAESAVCRVERSYGI